MSKKGLIAALFTVLIVISAAGSGLAQDTDLPLGLDTSTHDSYQRSLTDIYAALPDDKKLQFEVFFYVNLDGGKKPLQSLEQINKQGFDYLLKLYPVVYELERKGMLKVNSLTGAGIIIRGRELINAWLLDHAEKAANAAAKENLDQQLEIVNKETLTESDIQRYSELWRAYSAIRFKKDSPGPEEG